MPMRKDKAQPAPPDLGGSDDLQERVSELYTDSVIEQIADTLPKYAEPSRAHDFPKIIRDWAIIHLANVHGHEPPPPAKEARQKLTRLGVAAEKLMVALGDLDSWTRYQFTCAIRGSKHWAKSPNSPFSPAEAMNKISVSVALTRDAAAEACEGLSRRSGPRGNPVRRLAVAELIGIYVYLTGLEPTRRVRTPIYDDAGREHGPLRDFVVAALRPIEREDTEVGINSMIKELIPIMAESGYRTSLVDAIIERGK